MTYLTPDDWGLNRNIAPGDARGPQPDPQPRPRYAGDQDGMWGGNASRGLKPAPPFTGYFGPPVSAPAYDGSTRSPFAVPDGLFTEGVVPLNKLHGEGVLGPVMPVYSGVQGLAGLGYAATARGLVPIPVTLVRRPGSTMRRIGRRIVADAAVMSMMGLGADPTSQDVLNKMSADMKTAAMETAASQTALLISLNYVPVIGTAVSIVLGVVMAMAGNEYQKKAKLVLAQLTTDLNNLALSYQQKLQVVKMAVFDQEKGAGIQLALSGTTLNGYGLGDIWQHWKQVVSPATHLNVLVKAIEAPAKPILKTAIKIAPKQVAAPLQQTLDTMDRVDTQLNRLEKNADGGLALLAGETQLNLARTRSEQAYAAASKDMDAQYQAAVRNVQSPQYRQALQVVLAKSIRSNPNMAALISSVDSTQAQSLVASMTAGGAPTGTVPVVPAGATTGEKVGLGVVPLIGAVVAFLALGGRG